MARGAPHAKHFIMQDMMHPVHWAHVERWFDSEYPEWLVDTQIVHSVCSIDEPVIIE